MRSVNWLRLYPSDTDLACELEFKFALKTTLSGENEAEHFMCGLSVLKIKLQPFLVAWS